MAGPAPHNLRRAPGRVRIWGALLAVAVLIPVTLLFVEHWRDVDTRRDFAEQERQGIEYVSALGQVTAALTRAQTAAVTGEPVPGDEVDSAIAATDAVDARLGERFRVGERWAELRTRIGQVTATDHADPPAAYAAYGEVAELLLDLHNKLRETSGLIRDADADVYYLQDGAVEELPEAVVAAGRLADLVAIGLDAPDAAQAVQSTEVSVARLAVVGPANDLATDLQAALDNTRSRTLSSRVLSSHDQFLRQKDSLLAAVPANGAVAGVDGDQVRQDWAGLHEAAFALLGALLAEMDAVLDARIDTLAGKQRNAVLTLVVAVLLVAGLLWTTLTGARWPRRRRSGAALAPPAEPAAPPTTGEVAAADRQWERTGAR